MPDIINERPQRHIDRPAIGWQIAYSFRQTCAHVSIVQIIGAYSVSDEQPVLSNARTAIPVEGHSRGIENCAIRWTSHRRSSASTSTARLIGVLVGLPRLIDPRPKCHIDGPSIGGQVGYRA